ncbi:Uncharacterised protein [Candidatus Gugararchaeum adminiculabundum]|nr:Uncharacterised protein [Candidatus Gugararchaeum adminiculabundum]
MADNGPLLTAYQIAMQRAGGIKETKTAGAAAPGMQATQEKSSGPQIGRYHVSERYFSIVRRRLEKKLGKEASGKLMQNEERVNFATGIIFKELGITGNEAEFLLREPLDGILKPTPRRGWDVSHFSSSVWEHWGLDTKKLHDYLIGKVKSKMQTSREFEKDALPVIIETAVSVRGYLLGNEMWKRTEADLGGEEARRSGNWHRLYPKLCRLGR